MRYYILDDDLASRRMLSRIITEELLGEILGETDDAKEAEIDIVSNQPDIVLIDLLMPIQDGIETVHHLRKRNFKGKFIMISQVENKEMVAKAYSEGIEYFIHKPINKVEVSTIMKKVAEQIKMEQSISKIKESLAIFQQPEEEERHERKNLSVVFQHILGDLGILGESGSSDLVEIVEFFYKHRKEKPYIVENMPLKEIYVEVLKQRQEKVNEKDLKAFEQRIRRTVNQVMTNLASLGLTDYSNPKFEHYASKFFDFNEIRMRMKELDSDKVKRKAKINLRKFIYALYNEALAKLD